MNATPNKQVTFRTEAQAIRFERAIAAACILAAPRREGLVVTVQYVSWSMLDTVLNGEMGLDDTGADYDAEAL